MGEDDIDFSKFSFIPPIQEVSFGEVPYDDEYKEHFGRVKSVSVECELTPIRNGVSSYDLINDAINKQWMRESLYTVYCPISDKWGNAEDFCSKELVERINKLPNNVRALCAVPREFPKGSGVSVIATLGRHVIGNEWHVNTFTVVPKKKAARIAKTLWKGWNKNGCAKLNNRAGKFKMNVCPDFLFHGIVFNDFYK